MAAEDDTHVVQTFLQSVSFRGFPESFWPTMMAGWIARKRQTEAFRRNNVKVMYLTEPKMKVTAQALLRVMEPSEPTPDPPATSFRTAAGRPMHGEEPFPPFRDPETSPAMEPQGLAPVRPPMGK